MGLRTRIKNRLKRAAKRVVRRLSPVLQPEAPVVSVDATPPTVTPPAVTPPAVNTEPAPAKGKASTDASNPPDAQEAARIEAQAIEQIQTIFDPEIPVNIYELGLIYGVKVAPTRRVDVTMTLTSPNCPAAQSLPAEVKQKVSDIPGVQSAEIVLVWEPPWGPERMSEAARLELNL